MRTLHIQYQYWQIKLSINSGRKLNYHKPSLFLNMSLHVHPLLKCSVLSLLLGSLYASFYGWYDVNFVLCQACMIHCVTKAMPIHFINGKCYNYKETEREMP